MKYFSDERINGLALMLRAFAEDQASERNIRFWNILRNKAIVSICNELPTTVEDLFSKKVLIGKKTIENYGEAIVDIVSKWLASQNDSSLLRGQGLPSVPSPDKAMSIKQGGFYYNVSGNDALLLHKHLGYKLHGVKTPRTGFPVSVQDTVLRKLDRLSIDYDLLNQFGEIVASKRFERNCYETIGEVAPSLDTAIVPLRDRKKPFNERVSAYISILQGLSENIDVVTGEVVEGLSEDVKLQLFEMSIYFDDRLKKREEQDSRYPEHGRKWTSDEDSRLLAEYKEGKTIKELAQLHSRSAGAIRSRLLKLNVQ